MNNQDNQKSETSEFQKKYLDFSGRIRGSTYFFRALLANILAFVGGYLCGWGWYMSFATLIFGAVMLFFVLWYNLATVYKRANAIDPKNVRIWTGATATMSAILIFDDGSPFFTIVNILGIILHIYFIFQNAKPQTEVEKN